MNKNTKILGFAYKNKVYNSKTKVLYNGKCILNEKEIVLNNAVVNYMYSDGRHEYFRDDNNIYMCHLGNFTKNIVSIVIDENKNLPIKTTEEFYWTDEMVMKTIWYIIIMLLAIIFNERILIWIFATIVWYSSTFKKN